MTGGTRPSSFVPAGVAQALAVHATSAWRTAKRWPLEYANWLDRLGQWLRERGPQNNLLGYTGFVSAFVLPIIVSVISLLVVLVAECVIVVYAVLASALWGIAVAVGVGPRAVRRVARRV